MKRFLAVFLCLCLIGLGGFTMSAKADLVCVHVGGTELSEDGSSVTGGSGTATLTYENGNPVLTLNDYTYSGAGHNIDHAAIYYSDFAPLTIRLAGTSSVTHVSGATDQRSCGFYSTYRNAAITIEGDGSLELYSGSSQWHSYGMEVSGPLTILGGQVKAVGGNLNISGSSGYSFGISCEESLSIQGGTVIATGGNVNVENPVTGRGDVFKFGTGNNRFS